MRSRTFAAIAALLVWTLLTPAMAQEREQAPRAPVSRSTLDPRLAQTPFGRPSLPTFKVEAIGVRAIDESGPDWQGSDEVYAVIHPTPATGFGTHTLEGIDTGETHSFSPAECFLPFTPPGAARSACDAARGVVSISFELELYERDHDPLLGFCPSYAPGNAGPCPNDDLIGKTTISFSDEQLRARMPNVGDTDVRWAHLGGPCGWNDGAICGSSPYSLEGTGPEYLFIYRITRMADTLGPREGAPR